MTDDNGFDRRELLRSGSLAVLVAAAGCSEAVPLGDDESPTETTYGYGGTPVGASSPTDTDATASDTDTTAQNTATATAESTDDYGEQGYGEYGYGGVPP